MSFPSSFVALVALLSFAGSAHCGEQNSPEADVKSSEALVKKWRSRGLTLDSPKPDGSKPSTQASASTLTRSTSISKESLSSLRGAARGVGALPIRGLLVVPASGTDDASFVASVAVVPESEVTFDNILFKVNSTELLDPASATQLREIARAMTTLQKDQFLIEGHTCDLGKDAYNKGLSERRANAIRALLVGMKVAPTQLLTLGFGETDPVTPNTNETSRALNRRVIIRKVAP